VGRVLRNAVNWAYNPAASLDDPADAPNVAVAEALEPIRERGPKLHKEGDKGLR